VERPYPSVEFESRVRADGTLSVPAPIARRLRTGSVLTVRVTAGIVGKRLRTHSINEDDVERIALLQREEREHVLDALRAEGSLGRNAGFRRRARLLLRRRA
jgi:hypothetical protein